MRRLVVAVVLADELCTVGIVIHEVGYEVVRLMAGGVDDEAIVTARLVPCDNLLAPVAEQVARYAWVLLGAVVVVAIDIVAAIDLQTPEGIIVGVPVFKNVFAIKVVGQVAVPEDAEAQSGSTSVGDI